jgi:hypothetical protein
MGNGPYFAVLLIGVLIVFVDGRLLLRGSPAYLAQAYPDPSRARQVAVLVSVGFHAVMLGLVALVSSIGLGADANLVSVVRRVGVLLLLTAALHAATMLALSRLREQEAATELVESHLPPQVHSSSREEQLAREPVRDPNAGAASPTPQASAEQSTDERDSR